MDLLAEQHSEFKAIAEKLLFIVNCINNIPGRGCEPLK
jgi:hypothetical protein